jgi:hypothetical protein
METASFVQRIYLTTILPYVIHIFKITKLLNLAGKQGPISKTYER